MVDFVKDSFPIIATGSRQERNVLNIIAFTVKNNFLNYRDRASINSRWIGNCESGHFIMLYDLEAIVLVE